MTIVYNSENVCIFAVNREGCRHLLGINEFIRSFLTTFVEEFGI